MHVCWCLQRAGSHGATALAHAGHVALCVTCFFSVCRAELKSLSCKSGHCESSSCPSMTSGQRLARWQWEERPGAETLTWHSQTAKSRVCARERGINLVRTVTGTIKTFKNWLCDRGRKRRAASQLSFNQHTMLCLCPKCASQKRFALICRLAFSSQRGGSAAGVLADEASPRGGSTQWCVGHLWIRTVQHPTIRLLCYSTRRLLFWEFSGNHVNFSFKYFFKS